MTIDEIITKGKEAMIECQKQGGYVGTYYSGESVEQWKSYSTRYVECNFGDDIDSQRYREIAINGHCEHESDFNELFAILNALKEFPPTPKKQAISDIILNICKNFNRFDISVKRRHSNRSTININDEYDVQDVLYSILKLFIDDIRPEDYVPSYAGGNSRVDFLLPEYKTVIETKMTNSNLKDKEIGEQLLIDIARYQQNLNCKNLICFIYDKQAFISNPHGLISDLEKNKTADISISVIISPL